MFHDFEEIKKSHPIEDVAKRLGLKLTKTGNSYRCPCPSGQGNERALVITPEKGWYSFGLNEGGDVIGLVSLVKKLPPKEAAAWIVGQEPQEKPSEGFKELDYLDPNHPAVFAVGIDEAVAEAVGIGFSPKGILKGTIAIPIRLPTGKLIGYLGVSEVKLPPKWHL